MHPLKYTVVLISVLIVALLIGSSAPSCEILGNREAVTYIGDPALLHLESKLITISQSSGSIQMLSIKNDLPESVAVTVDVGTPAFVEDITVTPDVLSPGESCSVILDYDASGTQLGQYSLNLVIEASGMNSYIVLYRQVEITVVAASFYAEGLGGAFASPFTAGSATLESDGEEITLTVNDHNLMWIITDCGVTTSLNPSILEVLDYFEQREWYNKLVEEMGQPETWTTQTCTGENGGDTITVKIFNDRYVFSYSQNEERFTSFFVGKL